MSQAPRSATVFALIGVAGAALGFGLWIGSLFTDTGRGGQGPDVDASVFEEARPLEPFSLVDHRGGSFDRDTLQGQWTFMFFGFTHCPDICPMTLEVLDRVHQRLAGEGQDVRYVFVSVDPERDTPEQLADYLPYFNEEFVGVTGDPEELERLTRQLGIVHAKEDAPDHPDDYLVDHTASVILVDPAGQYRAVFSAPHRADTMAADFRAIRDHYRPRL